MFVLFVRSAEIATDSRLSKYCSALAELSIKYRIAYWQRSTFDTNCDKKNFVFNRSARYGARYGNIFNLILWAFFVSATIFRQRKNIRYVHSVDLDSGLVSLLWCKLCSIPFVYDIYDCYSDSRGLTGSTKKFIDLLERLVISNSDLSILADASRYNQLGITDKNPNIMVIENVPPDQAVETSSALDSDGNEKFRLCYFGNLEAEYRGLEDVLQFCIKNSFIELHVAGIGALSSLFQKSANEYQNVHFYGPMKHMDGLALMKSCDAIIGLYYLAVENHRFAAPNKYYEHLLVGKPIITSKGTPPGKKVDDLNTGISVSDGINCISEAVHWMDGNRNEAAALGINARKVWEMKYSSYFDEISVGSYIPKWLSR